MTSVLGCAPKPTMLRTSSGNLYWAKERSEAKYGTGMIACDHMRDSSASPREVRIQQGSTSPQDAGIGTGCISDLLRQQPRSQVSRHKQECEDAAQRAHAVCRLTLTKESGETGLRWPDAASEGAFLTVGAGRRWSRKKTCTVPLSEDRASHWGLSPLLNAMLYMHAGSAPLRSSCTFRKRWGCWPSSLTHNIP